MKKRDKIRLSKRWAWERIVEALEGLRLAEWPFDDPEFEEISNGPDRTIYEKSVEEIIRSLRVQYVKEKKTRENDIREESL